MQRSSSLESSADIGGDWALLILELAPSYPDHTPAIAHQDSIPLSIGLKGVARSMDGPPIELNDQSLPCPSAIRREESTGDRDISVESRPRKRMRIQHRHKELLEIVFRGALATGAFVQQKPKERRTRAPRVPREQIWNR